MLHIRCSPPPGPVLDCWQSPPLVSTPMQPRCQMCAVVPVRDEAQFLGRTLAALADQKDSAGLSLDWRSYEVIVLANNCTDESAVIARHFAARHPGFCLHVVEVNLSPGEAHVGRARQLLMDEAYRRLMGANRTLGIIASTDGDSRVAPDWLAAIRFEIERGADAVGGRIYTDATERAALERPVRLFHLLDVGYQYLAARLESCLDPDPFDRWPRHYQHYGASLALTAEAYGRSGGMPPVRTPEDVALYGALLRIDARFRHSPLVRVVTSARPVGRTSIGLAAQLSAWGAAQEHLVDPARVLEARFLVRRRLRHLWRQAQFGAVKREATVLVAEELHASSEWLEAELACPQPFGLLWEKVSSKRQPPRGVPVHLAVEELRVCIERRQRR